MCIPVLYLYLSYLHAIYASVLFKKTMFFCARRIHALTLKPTKTQYLHVVLFCIYIFAVIVFDLEKPHKSKVRIQFECLLPGRSCVVSHFINFYVHSLVTKSIAKLDFVCFSVITVGTAARSATEIRQRWTQFPKPTCR